MINYEKLVMELNDLQIAINIMKLGCEAVHNKSGTGCLAIVEKRIEQIVSKLEEPEPRK